MGKAFLGGFLRAKLFGIITFFALSTIYSKKSMPAMAKCRCEARETEYRPNEAKDIGFPGSAAASARRARGIYYITEPVARHARLIASAIVGFHYMRRVGRFRFVYSIWPGELGLLGIRLSGYYSL